MALRACSWKVLGGGDAGVWQQEEPLRYFAFAEGPKHNAQRQRRYVSTDVPHPALELGGVLGTLFCNVSFHVGPWCTPPGGRRYVDGIFTPKGPGGGVINPFMQPASGAVAQALPKPSVAKPATKPARQEAAVPLRGELPFPRPRLGPNPKIGKDGAGTCEIIGDLVYYLVLTGI